MIILLKGNKMKLTLCLYKVIINVLSSCSFAQLYIMSLILFSVNPPVPKRSRNPSNSEIGWEISSRKIVPPKIQSWFSRTIRFRGSSSITCFNEFR